MWSPFLAAFLGAMIGGAIVVAIVQAKLRVSKRDKCEICEAPGALPIPLGPGVDGPLVCSLSCAITWTQDYKSRLKIVA